MKLLLSILFLQVIAITSLFSQKKACELTDVASINSILNSKLQYDATSIINKSGKFECRYTDPATPGKYVSIGLLDSKVEFGYDMLKTQFEADQKSIASGNKAGGNYTKFYAYPKGGSNAYYMTAPKNDFSNESFRFVFRKVNYILTFTAEALPPQNSINKVDALFQLLSSKL